MMKNFEGSKPVTHTVEAYLKQPYLRSVVPQEDGSFLATIIEFPGCIATGDTMQEALENLDAVAASWLDAVLSAGQSVPNPMDSADYSGKLVVRMPRGLHKRAALRAEHEGVSLNQFIVACIAECLGESKAKKQTAEPSVAIEAVTDAAINAMKSYASLANAWTVIEVSSDHSSGTRPLVGIQKGFGREGRFISMGNPVTRRTAMAAKEESTF